MAEQNHNALHEKLIAVQDELDRTTQDHERQRHDWRMRHGQHVSQINSLESELSGIRQQRDDNRSCSSRSSSRNYLSHTVIHTGWRKKTGPPYLIANILKIP